MKDQFVQVTDKKGTAISQGDKVQVTERNHWREGMVGEILYVTTSGRLKLESRSGTLFDSLPEHVTKTAPETTLNLS
jgi:hypothetical protein